MIGVFFLEYVQKKCHQIKIWGKSITIVNSAIMVNYNNDNNHHYDCHCSQQYEHNVKIFVKVIFIVIFSIHQIHVITNTLRCLLKPSLSLLNSSNSFPLCHHNVQVCRQWREVLYQPPYWRQVRPVLHCR